MTRQTLRTLALCSMLATFSLVLASESSAAALSLAAPQATAQQQIFTPEAFKAHVSFLADDLLEGRRAGTRGHALAAAYVANQFGGMGLGPAGTNGTWFQSVRLQQSSFSSRGASVTFTGPDGSATFIHGADVLLQPSLLEPREIVDAPVVFVGFGLDAPEHGFNDYQGLDVRGKVVIALTGSPKGTPSELGAYLADQKLKMAGKRGAIAVLRVSTLIAEKLFSYERRRAQLSGQPNVTWLGDDGRPYVETPQVRVRGHLSVTAAEAAFAGSGRTLKSILSQADRGGSPKGLPLKTKVRIELDSTQQIIESPNVVALLPGADPVLKEEHVVLMAHLDHLGIGPEKNGDRIYNGAMDNAAGVATILEAARAMAASPSPPRRSVLFLAVTAEEYGLLGTEYFARYPTVVPIEKIAAAVNVDMPMLRFDFADIVAFGSESSTLGQFAAKAAAGIGVALSPDPEPAQQLFIRTDHYALVKQGIPAVYLTIGAKAVDGGHAGAELSKAFWATHYHNPSDEIAWVDWNAGAKFTKVTWLLVSAIANADERPRWYEGDFFGRTFAANAPKAKRPKP